MRKLAFIVAVSAALAACSAGGGGQCPTAIGMDCTADLSCGRADLAGTPRQICGMPDASFSPSLCACVGDP